MKDRILLNLLSTGRWMVLGGVLPAKHSACSLAEIILEKRSHTSIILRGDKSSGIARHGVQQEVFLHLASRHIIPVLSLIELERLNIHDLGLLAERHELLSKRSYPIESG